tara:strand:+ start:450 stop:608 length:159 start_codon:yes stop_codon:yes gene_type:complete
MTSTTKALYNTIKISKTTNDILKRNKIKLMYKKNLSEMSNDSFIKILLGGKQ